MDDNEIPRWLRILSTAWPIGAALLLGGATVVRADAKIGEVGGRVDYLYANGVPIVAERLGRIEERQKADHELLVNIDQLLRDDRRR